MFIAWHCVLSRSVESIALSSRSGTFSEEGNIKLLKLSSNKCQLWAAKYFFSQEGAEKQAQLERSLREKAAVEKELEKVSISPQGTYLSW